MNKIKVPVKVNKTRPTIKTAIDVNVKPHNTIEFDIKPKMKSKKASNYDNKGLYTKLIENINSKGLANTTKLFYLNCLTKINAISGLPKDTFDPDTYLNNIDNYIKYFSDSTPTKDNQLKAMMMFYKAVGVPIPQPIIDLRNTMKNQLHSIETNKPKKAIPLTTRQQLVDIYNNWTSKINDILEYSYNVKTDIMRYLAVCCYCTMPPFRPSEWLNLKIVNNDNVHEGNYLDINTGKIIYNDYKTSHNWGQLHDVVSAEVLEAVRSLYDHLDEVNGYKYLFTTNSRNPEIMGSGNFTNFFKSINGFEGCTPNDIRNLYCSTIPPETSLEDRARIASMMKHSVASQMLIYSKYNSEAYPNQVVSEK